MRSVCPSAPRAPGTRPAYDGIRHAQNARAIRSVTVISRRVAQPVARAGQASTMRLGTALAIGALAASAAGCRGSANTSAHAPTPGPFFSDLSSVRGALSHGGVSVSSLTPGAAPDSVLPQPAHSYRIATRGGTQMTVLIYATPQKAMRARASAGPHTALGNNVLAVISRHGTDVQRVRRVFASLDHRPV